MVCRSVFVYVLCFFFPGYNFQCMKNGGSVWRQNVNYSLNKGSGWAVSVEPIRPVNCYDPLIQNGVVFWSVLTLMPSTTAT